MWVGSRSGPDGGQFLSGFENNNTQVMGDEFFTPRTKENRDAGRHESGEGVLPLLLGVRR